MEREGEEVLLRLGEAVGRLGEGARAGYREQVDLGRRLMGDRSRREVLEGLLTSRAPTDQGSAGEPSENESEEDEATDPSDEEESTDEVSSSDEESSSEEEEPSPAQHPWQQSGPSFTQQQQQYRASYQQQEANLAWYQQWSAGLAQQRQQLVWQQYWAQLARARGNQ